MTRLTSKGTRLLPHSAIRLADGLAPGYSVGYKADRQVEDEGQDEDGYGGAEGERADPGPVDRQCDSYYPCHPCRHVEPGGVPVRPAALLQHVLRRVVAALQEIVVGEHDREDRDEECPDEQEEVQKAVEDALPEGAHDRDDPDYERGCQETAFGPQVQVGHDHTVHHQRVGDHHGEE